jgi:hypothetical protein
MAMCKAIAPSSLIDPSSPRQDSAGMIAVSIRAGWSSIVGGVSDARDEITMTACLSGTTSGPPDTTQDRTLVLGSVARCRLEKRHC